MVGALLVGFLLVRLPFRTDFLVNWDAVNFALGITEGFDLRHHQPHPPGYIGYVVVGRGLAWLTGDANAGLTLLSVIAGALAPAGMYVLARRFVAQGPAVASALLFGTAPLVWHYSLVALTYVVAAAIIVPLVWACHVARTERSARHLTLAGVLLAALGAFRQTDMVLLAPVLAYAAAALPARDRWRTAVLTGGLTLAWLVPLLWMSGGPSTYLHLSAELAGKAGGRTSIFSLDPDGVLANLQMVALGIGAGLFVGLVPLLVAWRRRVAPLAGISADDRRILVLWAAPALLVYLLLHTGQLGYMLVILPIGYLAIALILAESRLGRRGLGLAMAANTAAFLILPAVSDAYRRSQVEAPEEAPVSLVVADEHLAETIEPDVRPSSLEANDEYWQDKVELLDDLDPDRSVVLTTTSGSFRPLSYYLPDYYMYAIGNDPQGRFGHLYTAHEGENDYEIDRLQQEGAETVLELPPAVDHLVVADARLQELIAPAGQPFLRTRVDEASYLLHMFVEPGSSVVFTGSADGEDAEEPAMRVVPPES